MRVFSLTVFAVLVALSIFIEECDSQRPNTRRRQRRRRRRPRPRRPTTRAPLPCPPIPHIDNGQGLDTGSTVRYACEPGFVLEGTNVITCLNGRWTVAPRCRQQLCPLPPNVPFAKAPQLSNGGVTATYECLANYRIMGGNGATTATVSCSTQTQFWPTLPSCEPIPVTTCSGPPTVANAMSTFSNNIATYTCNTGYRRVVGTPTQIVCGSTGWPTVGLPMCEIDPSTNPDPVQCNKSPPCGDDKINREAVADSYAIGSSVAYKCVTGYRIVGSNSNTNDTASSFCKTDGTWTTTPTCEPVVCGVPTAGVNTVAVTATSISYPGTYTYACSANYETGTTLETKCLADGKWSLDPAPTCTQIMCPASALPALANANFLSQDVAIGGTVTYTCLSDYRLAPQSLGALTTQTVTCQADKTFTALASTCVYQHPESCRDYFTRDNLFPLAADGCTTVIIDPQGPNLADPANPPAVQVQCCKSGTSSCTRVTPTGGNSYTVPAATPCTGTASTVIPGTTSADVTISAICDSPQTVVYPVTDAQLSSMIRSTTGTCKQITTINCAATALSMSLALKVASEPSGFLYGTNAFSEQGADYSLSHYAYAGAPCDCARNAAVTLTSTCNDGCVCAKKGTTAVGLDTITKHITADNLAYVESYQLTQHNGEVGVALADIVVNVGHVECCETF